MASVEGIIPDAPEKRSSEGDLDRLLRQAEPTIRRRIVLNGETLGEPDAPAVVHQVVIDTGLTAEPASNPWAGLLDKIVAGWPATLRTGLLLIILLGGFIALVAVLLGVGSAAVAAVGLLAAKLVVAGRGKRLRT